MQQVLREVSLPNNNFSSVDSLNVDKAQTSHENNLSLENDPSQEDCDRTEENSESGKENVSQLDYGARDDQHGDDSDSWTSFDSDPQPEVENLSEHVFNNSNAEKAVLKHLSGIVLPSCSDPKPTESANPIVATLQTIAASQVPDMNPMRDIFTSENLPTSLREAYPHSLIPSVYDVMLRHKTFSEAQVLGAQLLQKIAMYVPRAASKIGKGNGIQLIVRSMILNSDCLAVQAASAAALAALCSNPENRTIAGKFYAVEAILSATKKFNEERYLQGASMKLLTALAAAPENVDVIVNTRSIRIPLHVIKRHKESNILVRIACECAHQLLKSFDETDMNEIAEMKPTKIFLSAMIAFPDDERIQVAATECMIVFCAAGTDYLQFCVNARAADICVRNLKRFRGFKYGRLHLACMEMLCMFADAGFSRTVVVAGALEGCVPCMIEMRKVFAMQLCCLRLLERVVTTGEESFLQRIITAGGLEVLSGSLKMYISREDFVNRGVRVMRVLRG